MVVIQPNPYYPLDDKLGMSPAAVWRWSWAKSPRSMLSSSRISGHFGGFHGAIYRVNIQKDVEKNNY